ncbi:MAG: cytochrome c oxidase subunit I, partial [Actinomycetota bacterium]|nr:cytochrome c oxidase subunit I [Actinomycetota bacterium]
MVAKLRAPGMIRAALGTLIGIALSYLIIFIMRSWYDLDPVLDGFAVLELSLFLAPIGFLIGLGAFDYWFHYMSGRPTRPEDHSGHGAKTWRDYFRVNTDHKVIGIQYVVTSFFFFFVGGLFAMLMRAELAQPGRQFV